MSTSRPRRFAAAVLCVTALAASALPAGRAEAEAAAAGRSAGAPPDVAFLSGMIVHHRQAILIAGWAPTHGAGPALRELCERIVNEGALTMVQQLLGAQDAAQDPYVFQSASDINADQTAEIDRMHRMLADEVRQMAGATR